MGSLDLPLSSGWHQGKPVDSQDFHHGVRELELPLPPSSERPHPYVSHEAAWGTWDLPPPGSIPVASARAVSGKPAKTEGLMKTQDTQHREPRRTQTELKRIISRG